MVQKVYPIQVKNAWWVIVIQFIIYSEHYGITDEILTEETL